MNNGRIKIDGQIDTNNKVRISDDWSSSGGAVEVEPFYCKHGEEIKFKITMLMFKDSEVGEVYIWDGHSLKTQKEYDAWYSE